MEVVEGADYDAIVRSRVFSPAGMDATGALPEQEDVPDRARGYMRGETGWTRADRTFPFRGTPAGGGYSTVHDLDRFATALRRNRLLDPHHTRELTSPKVEAGEGRQYAYGFMLEAQNEMQTLGHSGAAPGMAAVFRTYPAQGWLVVVLTNRDAPAATMVADFIGDRLAAAAP